MKKICCGGFLLAVVSIIVLITCRPAQVAASPLAAPQTYNTFFSTTNVYVGDALIYDFTGLDSATQYIFHLYATDLLGNLTQSLSTKIVGPGVTVWT